MKRYISLWMMLFIVFVFSIVLFASSAYAANTNNVTRVVKKPPTLGILPSVKPGRPSWWNSRMKTRSLKAAAKPSIVWTETATTNDQGQVTRILIGTKQDGSTITVCPLYNGWEVPFEFRQKILTIPEEERQYLVSMGPEKRTDMQSSGDKPNVPAPAGTDTIQTDEIRVIDLRW